MRTPWPSLPQAGRTEPFNENVAQVKRLINRDRKEFLGNADDILDKYTTEFGDAQPSTATPAGKRMGELQHAGVTAAAPVCHGDNAHELVLFLTWIATLCASQLAM